MQQQGSNILHIDPSPQPWGWDQKVKIHFLEHGHVAYQIKGNGECSRRMQQYATTYSVLTHTLDPWGGTKGQNIFF